ncbi:MAG TPA: T9SS type A sorting domain-containing protein, partial [Chitinophagales bacterium]
IYIDSSSTGSTADYLLVNTSLNAPTGISHDTAYVQIVNDDIMEPTEELRFHIKWNAVNTTTSSDTVFTITILDTDSAEIGFFGAGAPFLENAGTVGVPVVSSSSFSYETNIAVSYYNGNAVPFVDYIFNDTTLVMPANTADTPYANVMLIDNQFYTGMRQVNLRIDSVYPLTGRSKIGITQYSLFILDDDSITSGVIDVAKNELNIYPNPFSNHLTIQTEKTLPTGRQAATKLEILNLNGQAIYEMSPINNSDFTEINTENWASGMYFVQVFTDEKTYTLKVVKSE